MSVVSVRATSLDICEFVYGDDTPVDGIARLYEPNATHDSCAAQTLTIIHSYENPFLIATSRSVILDIHRLSHQLSSLDIPRPLAMLCTLFRLKVPERTRNANVLFHGLRVWSEMGEICENESFDGHKKAIVEHTLNILLLPGIHCEGNRLQGTSGSLVSALSPLLTLHPYISSPAIRLPGTSLSIPSPFHFQLHVVTRLSFNEQGRVTHHRDFWDVKDVLGLVPGVSLAQWVGSRIAALGLSYASKLWTGEALHSVEETASAEEGDLNVTSAVSQATDFASPTKDALMLNGV